MACCFVGERPDLDLIDAFLLQPGASLSAAERQFTISRGSLRKHLRECLGATHPTGIPTGYVSPVLPGIHNTKAASNPQDPSGMPFGATPNPVAQLLAPPKVHVSQAILWTTEEEQVAFLSALIEGNRFYFGDTLAWLERTWKLSPTEIRRRYEAAIARCSTDRQVDHAEKVVALGAFEAQERAAWSEHRRLRKTEPSQARGYLSLAIKARSEWAAIAGLKTARMEVSGSINIWHRPEFVMEVERFTETTLDVLAPQDEKAADAMLDRARIAAERVLGQAVDPAIVAALGAALMEQLQSEAAARFGALAAEGSGQAAPFQVDEAPELPEPEPDAPEAEQQAAE